MKGHFSRSKNYFCGKSNQDGLQLGSLRHFRLYVFSAKETKLDTKDCFLKLEINKIPFFGVFPPILPGFLRLKPERDGDAILKKKNGSKNLINLIFAPINSSLQ